jgi:hypothetical protein
MDAIAPYLGFIFLALGLVMVFFGARFVLYVFAVLSGLVVATLAFLLCYNLVLGEYSTTKGALIGVVVVCAILALLFSFLAYKFLKSWAIAIIAAWCGVAVFVPLSKVIGLKGTGISIGAAITGAVVGFYIGKKFNVYVRSIGTAIIGAFLSSRGLGTFIGNYPSETDIINNTSKGKYNPVILGYVAFMICLAIIGSIFQIKTNKDKKSEDDEVFENEDEAKRCC